MIPWDMTIMASFESMIFDIVLIIVALGLLITVFTLLKLKRNRVVSTLGILTLGVITSYFFGWV
jgi:mannose/fructose/N-acetylgalactosamine-specific phosphotransferase system component IID